MKDEFSDLYNDIVTEEKQEEFPLSFNDFLDSTKQATPTKKTVRRIPSIFYKVAAVFVLLLSLGIWINSNSIQDDKVKQVVNTTTTPKERLAIRIPALPNKQEINDKKRIEKESNALKADKLTSSKTLTKKLATIEASVNSPDETEYIIINGKPIYDKEEALEATKNALSLVVMQLNEPKQSTQKLKLILKRL